MSKPNTVTLTIGRSPERGIEWHAWGSVPMGRRSSGKPRRWRSGLTPSGSRDCAGSGSFPRLPHSGDVSDAIPRVYRATGLRSVQLRLCDAVRTDTPDGLIRLTWSFALPEGAQ